MSRLTQKIVAVLFAIWLPLFSGGALAASVAMQTHAVHEQDAMMTDCGMDDMDMSTQAGVTDEHQAGCDTCAVCHLACTAYLSVPKIENLAVQMTARDITPYLLAFSSHTSAPLLPPPLARV